MKAIVYTGAQLPELQEVEAPTLKEGEALLSVLQAGICGTDLSILSGKHPRAKAPLILGHELAARVDEVRGEAPFAPGDLVTVEPTLSCGSCVACKGGFPHVCQQLRLYGIDAPGGMAEQVAVQINRVVPAPKGATPDMVVLAEPLAVAVHAVRMSGIRYGDGVCVIGGGPIGLLTAIVARETTPVPILISEPEGSRRAIAEKLGFPVVDPTTEDLSEIVAKRSSGRGMDVVFEAAGSQPAVYASTAILRPRGRLIQVSIPKEPRSVSLVDLTFKEIEVQGVRVYEPYDFERALALLESTPELFRPLRSKTYRLDEAKQAFEAAKAGDQGLRVIFQIGQ